MAELCGYPHTVTGYPCENPVDAGPCAAGHLGRSTRRVAIEDDPFQPEPSTLEIEDLLSQPEDRSTGTGSPGRRPVSSATDLIPWRARGALIGAMGGIAADTGAWFAGAHDPVALGILAGVAFATAFVVQWSGHRDDIDRAESHRQTTNEALVLRRKRRATAATLRRLSNTLDGIDNTTARQRDEMRGELTGEVVHGLAGSLPNGSRVALYRPHGAELRPTPVTIGWQTAPPAIHRDEPLGETIVGLMRDGSVEHRTTRSGVDQVMAPIRSGPTLFGALIVEAPPGAEFDDADADLVSGYATLLGGGYAVHQSAPRAEETALYVTPEP